MNGAIVDGGRDLIFRAKPGLGRRIAGAALAVIGANVSAHARPPGWTAKTTSPEGLRGPT